MDIKLLILGIGNTLRKDDGIGIYLVKELENLIEREDVKIYEIGIETWRVLPIIKEERCRNVIIVDALSFNKIPGVVYIAKNPEILDISIFSLHEKNYLVEIGIENLGFVENIYIFGVEPYQIEWGFGLSDVLRGKFDEILNKLLNFCNLIIEKEKENDLLRVEKF